jgi:glycosyltransferase involved in cell wall biosynthesis
MRGGGAERVALRLIDDFLKAGHEVDLVLLQKIGELLPLLPPEVRVFDLAAPRVRNGLRPLVRYFRERRPHAMQISMWPLTVIGIVAHRLARSQARLVTSDHAALSKHFPPSRPFVYRSLTWSVRLFYPLASARIIVAKEAADDLARISGIDRRSIEVVYNPVGEAPADVRSTPEIEALWDGAERRIITVGTLKAQKNHQLLIRSFARAFRGEPVKLMILGEGELRQAVEALAAELGVADQLLFPGFTTDPWPFYASADLFALSSDYEGYPLVLIEALRSGLPIVSTDCESGPREILDGGRYGTLVPVGDEAALATAMKEALVRPHDADALRARAEQLSGQSTSDRYPLFRTDRSGDRASDDRSDRTSRPRRSGRLDRRRSGRRARASAPFHRRPLPPRAPADGIERRPLRDYLQRGDL